jgi:hypothetical protein
MLYFNMEISALLAHEEQPFSAWLVLKDQNKLQGSVSPSYFSSV